MAIPEASGSIPARTFKEIATLLGPFGRDVRVDVHESGLTFSPNDGDEDAGSLEVPRADLEPYSVTRPGTAVLGVGRLADFAKLPRSRDPVRATFADRELRLEIPTAAGSGVLVRTIRTSEPSGGTPATWPIAAAPRVEGTAYRASPKARRTPLSRGFMRRDWRCGR
ncbi:MAG: hypothetical protein WA688_00600 [Thermoplasmata archaeon]